MADNVVADPGVGGATFRTDELAGSIHVPFTKLMDGTDASTTVIVSGNGVAAGALRVTLASDGTGVVAATQSGTWTNTVTQGTATNLKTQSEQYVGGTAVSNANPVPISDAGGAITVDGTVAATQSGTWTMGLSAAQTLATVTTVGTVTTITNVVHVDDNSGSLSVDWNGTTPVTGSGTATGALRVELPTNGTGVLATLGTITNVVHVDDNSGNLSIDDGGNSITVDYATTGSGTATGALRVELPTNGTGVIATVGAVTAITNALPAGTNAIGKLSSNTGVTIGAVEIASAQTLATVTNVATIGTSVTPGTSAAHLGKAEDAAHSSGDTGVMLLAVRQSTATDMSVGNTNGDYEPLQVNASGYLYTTDQPQTSSGYLIKRVISAGSGDATNVKASAGQIYGWTISNINASPAYVKIYNTSGTPTAGSGTPVLTITIPGNIAGVFGHVEFSKGIAFATGIGLTIVTGVADSSSTGVAANEVVVQILYF